MTSVPLTMTTKSNAVRSSESRRCTVESGIVSSFHVTNNIGTLYSENGQGKTYRELIQVSRSREAEYIGTTLWWWHAVAVHGSLALHKPPRQGGKVLCRYLSILNTTHTESVPRDTR